MNKEKLEQLNKVLVEAKEQLAILQQLKEQQDKEIEKTNCNDNKFDEDDDNGDTLDIIFSCEKNNKKGKLVAGLYRTTSGYDSLEEDINLYSSETLYEYLTNSNLPSDEELREIMDVLEAPYKMYRRINDYLKKQQ